MEDNIFVYMGGGQVVPDDVTRVRIDPSVNIIPERAFSHRKKLVSVETHDGIEKIGMATFCYCTSLRGIKLPGVKEIEASAFFCCTSLTDVEFSDELETIGTLAFNNTSLEKIKMPTVRIIESAAFGGCEQLTEAEFGDKLERMEKEAFFNCTRLQRIAIPLKDDLFPLHTLLQRYSQFDHCENLTTVDLVGGIHKTISSLLLESWRNEMNQEIDRINQVLPNTPPREKADAIRLWITSVINRMAHFKAEHNALLRDDMTQLELALWKAKLDEDNESERDTLGGKGAKEAKIDVQSARKELRIISGADIIIKNVLPFLRVLE